MEMDGREEQFFVDSKPIEVCRVARGKRCKIGRTGNFSQAPDFGFCASQNMYYLGYKLHALCGLSGVIHSYDLSKARKRIETLFSQLTDQFLVIGNYAKTTIGLFARIIGKISALTILQYVNVIGNKPIGRIKYALN